MVIQEVFQAFLLIFVAEMGDKTQILAMAFATRYPIRKVLLGIFLGSLVNHGLAITFGTYVSRFLPIETIQMVAGLAFVGFALWTLKPEEEDDEDEIPKARFGPVLTVALAFFIGELGDKTQLTAITLGVDAVFPMAILVGTVSGMMVTGGIGILIGRTLGEKIPEFAIKVSAASIFMAFGLVKLYGSAPLFLLTVPVLSVFLGTLSFAVWMLVRAQLRLRQKGVQTSYQRVSKELYEYYHHIQADLDRLCLGVETCATCDGSSCIVGFSKEVIRGQLNQDASGAANRNPMDFVDLSKPFVKEDAIDSLVDTLKILFDGDDHGDLEPVHMIRKQLELLLVGQSISGFVDEEGYRRELEALDYTIASEVFSCWYRA